MDQEEGPNFSYAYGGTSAPSPAAWNPALRPDHDEPAPAHDPAQASDPRSEPKVQSKEILEWSQDDNADAPEPASSAASDDAPAHAAETASDTSATAGAEFFDQLASADAPQDLSEPSVQHVDGHGHSGDDDEALSKGVQGLDLGDSDNDSAHESQSSPEQAPQQNEQSETTTAEEHVADNYEHQGETTMLEDAVLESEAAPLVDDTEASAGDWNDSGEVFDLGGRPQDAPLADTPEEPLQTPHAEAVGTTVGDDIIGNTTVGGNTGEEIDWGAGGDQDFFGGASRHQENGQGSDGAAGGKSEWDLALDDDFLPDNDEAPPPFDLDEDGFLEDEPPLPAQPVQPVTNKYAPQVAQVPQPPANPYAPQGTQFANLAQQPSITPAAVPKPAYGAYGQFQQPQPPRPALPSSAQSFADKAKGGYASPYDLPEDVVTTRRRPAARPVVPSVQSTPPPPRSSSISSASGAAPPRPPPVSSMSVASMPPPSSSQPIPAAVVGGPPAQKPTPPLARKPSTDFFAELPTTSKPRPSGRYTPQQAPAQLSPPLHAPPQFPKERTSSWSSLRNEILPDSEASSQLRQPERLPVFPDQPSVPVRTNSLPVPPPGQPSVPSRYSPQPPSGAPLAPSAPAAPPASSRYSPAPPAAPAASSRYSPAPPSQGPAHNRYVSEPQASVRPPAHSHAPRTSSPLAFHATPQNQSVSEQQASAHQSMHSLENAPRPPYKIPLEGVSETEELAQAQSQASRPPTARSETPPLRSGPPSAVNSPRKRSNYAPQYQPNVQPQTSSMAPPARSNSQSPESASRQMPARQALHRPGSSYSVTAPSFAPVAPVAPAAPIAASSANVNIIPHKPQIAHDFDFIAPADERVSDPLERWKGHPVFHWGLGGTVVSSFPKNIPRYGGGASKPMMKCVPGEIRIQNVKEAFPLPEEIAKFPGPLKGKSKKKDVSSWLGQRIDALENQSKLPGFEQSLDGGDVKRFEEKILLWKIMQVLVDNDGLLEGNAAAEAAVRKVLSPEDTETTEDAASFSTAADLVGVQRTNTSLMQSEPVDPKAVEELRTLLTKGDREKAVWHAVDQRLWAHAMLLSSTLKQDIWKQVVQEFVRKEVKKVGRDNQALAVLYEIFAGNWEDCIDELVPASARAGFQMVSTDGAGSTQNALQGLEKWRETLSLVLSNRSNGDAAALLSLGRLLAGYGRVEAAHICFMFARSSAHFGGADDPQADVVLVGADHRANAHSLGHDLEPVLLSEVYEYALSLTAQTSSQVIPHLQNYKLAHAYVLAENGQRSDAQSYCDAIAAAMKSTTKSSPYYNASFIAHLDDLSKRLSQSPKDGSSSWISKPSMDKVSSSLLSKFNSFIAGDDEDAASTHSGQDIGPFARIAGSTPQISPTPSQADLYSAYAGYGGGAAPPSAGNSRYAPSANYSARPSLEQARSPYESQGRPSLDSQQSNPYMPSPSLSGGFAPSMGQFSPPSRRPEAAKTNSYAPLKAPNSSLSYGSPYQPTPPAEESASAFGGYQPSQPSFEESPPSPPAETISQGGGYAPPSMGGYEPPSSSYEPPSYQPYDADAEDKSSPDEQIKKKKSFMDLSDDEDSRAAQAKPKGKGKSDADRAADEAFRKAAEADAQKDKDAGNAKKGGWFGGWFKKEASTAGPGPIKAKLGEENSFYYDPDLKKWVNKKAGATEASRPMATPPPPKSGPPSRTVSGNSVAANHALGVMGPPSSLPNAGGPLSRGGPPTSNPQRSSSMPPPMSAPGSRASTPGLPSGDESSVSGSYKAPVLMRPDLAMAGSGPPSRPSTGLSTSSSIDDLLGAPSAKRGAAGKKKRGGRYVDVMAQK